MPYLVCAAAHAALLALILAQARRSRTGLLLAGAVATTALWAAAVAAGASMSGALDLLRLLAWYGFCLHLYRGPRARLFAALGVAGIGVAGALAAGGVLPGQADPEVSLLSPAILLRLALSVGQLLLLENLYRGTVPERRWHVGLACIALGGLAAYDLVVSADAVLRHAASAALPAGRPLVAALVTPLLAVAAARNRHWHIDIHVSRAAFYSASLVASGVFLLALAGAGELAQFGPQFGLASGPAFGSAWGSLVQICLVFAGAITVAVLASSGAARGALRHYLIDHFYTHRYDYRREWQRCIDTLAAAPLAAPLAERAIRALADVVDSPSGLLFLREPGQSGLAWAGAWNTGPAGTLPETSELVALRLPCLLAQGPAFAAPPSGLGPFAAWLAVPLHDPDPHAPPLGCILLGHPRAAFRLDAEVFDLLGILAHEVAVHLAGQRAAAVLLEARDLRAYGERFAFVAHDIKNVSGQLSLLLANAETHLANPEFQRDMLATVRASVARIGGLIRRLEPHRLEPHRLEPGPLEPGLRVIAAVRLDPATALAGLLAGRFGAAATLEIDPAAALVRIVMDETEFAAAITHLLDNAVAAAGPGGSVRLSLRATPARALIEIADDGPGMTPQFIRDELFRPFATRSAGGSGLGALQSRALLRAAGGDLAVSSRPAPAAGHGTTMRLSWPLADALAVPVAARLAA